MSGIVKPLDWEDFDGQGAKANAMLIASYLITRWSTGEFEVSVSCPGYSTVFDGDRFYPTLEAAKAAAQADYERRVLSALTTDPLALVADAYDAAAGHIVKQARCTLNGVSEDEADTCASEIRSLTPADARAAFDAAIREAEERERGACANIIRRMTTPATLGFGAALERAIRARGESE